MHSLLSIFFRWLHGVALALWLGGLVAIGALVAPTAFHVARSDPALAGGIVGGSLRLFNVLCYVGGTLLFLCNLILASLYRPRRGWAFACALLALLLLGSALYLGLILFPAIDLAQSRNQIDVFNHLHARYENFSGLQLPLLLLLAWLAAVRDMPVRSMDRLWN